MARDAPTTEAGSRAAAEPILRPGKNCWRVAEAARASVLVDAAPYFSTLRDAFERARSSILILGWDFDANVALDPAGDGPASRPLRDYLPDLLERRPTLEIRILIWGLSVLYAQGQAPPPRLDPGWPDHPRLRFRYANEHPLGACHHEKIVCVDDALAFAGGIDLTAMRWDEPTHDPGHPGRIDADGKPYRPVHDVQLAVDGEAASSLSELARTRWKDVTGEPVRPSGDADPWPDTLDVRLRGVPVGIARTRAAHDDRPEIREAEALTLDALSAARERVYIESQYLTSSVVGERLAELLERPVGPEIVAVVRRRSDGVIQRYSMGENRDRLLRKLSSVDRGRRLRAYYPVVVDEEGDEHEVDVHSKLIAVDDRLLRIGSSNLNNRSMGFDTECDLAIEARDGATRETLRMLTCELLAEHVGAGPEEIAAAIGREGLIGAVDRLGASSRRRLVPLPVEPDGPRTPLPGTALVDPDEPFGEKLPFG